MVTQRFEPPPKKRCIRCEWELPINSFPVDALNKPLEICERCSSKTPTLKHFTASAVL